MCVARIFHDGGHVGKVEVYVTGAIDQAGNGLYTAKQNFVSNFECVEKGNTSLGYLLQSLVRNDNQGVDAGCQLGNSFFRLQHTPASFKSKRLGNDTDGENTHLFREFGDNRCSASACATAHTGRDKYHIGTLQCFFDFIKAFFCGALTELGIGTCALAASHVATNDNFA